MGFTWFGLRGNSLRLLITLATASGFLLFGYDQGVFAGLIGGQAFKDTFGNPDKVLLGTIVSIYEIGCFFGAVFIMAFGERLGRKRSIFVGLGTMIVGAVLQTAAPNVATLIVGRIVTGLGNGANTSVIPVFQAETSLAKSRGRMISVEGWFITVGIVISYWITYGTAGETNVAVQYRTPIALQIVFAVITGTLLIGLPESPRWLAAHGRREEALDVLAQLDGDSIDSPDVQAQLAVIEESLAAESAGGPVQWKEYFQGGDLQTFRRLCLAYGIQMMQQLTGINAVIFYSAFLLENTLGLDRELSLIVGGCTGFCFMVFTAFPIMFIDKMGRRKPLMIGAALQAISMLLIAVLIKQDTKAAGTAAIIFVFVYIASYSGFGWVAGPWLYPTEINTLRFRSQGAALATSANWIWNFAVVKITPIGSENLGWGFFLIFMAFNAAFVPIIYFFYPETAGLSLEQISLIFSKTRNVDELEVRAEKMKVLHKTSTPVSDVEKA